MCWPWDSTWTIWRKVFSCLRFTMASCARWRPIIMSRTYRALEPLFPCLYSVREEEEDKNSSIFFPSVFFFVFVVVSLFIIFFMDMFHIIMHMCFRNGDIRVIRPLTYCRERLLRGYAKVMRFPVINDNCPACFAQPKVRRRTWQVFLFFNFGFIFCFWSLCRSVHE